MKVVRKAGQPPEGRLAIFDHKGNMRGHVTKAATQATVARFLGRHGAKLGTKDGKQAWIGDKPPPPLPAPLPAPVPAPKPESSKHSFEININGDKAKEKQKAKVKAAAAGKKP